MDQIDRMSHEKEAKSPHGVGTYEKPAIIYQGKLETYAIVCTGKTVGCAPQQST